MESRKKMKTPEMFSSSRSLFTYLYSNEEAAITLSIPKNHSLQRAQTKVQALLLFIENL